MGRSISIRVGDRRVRAEGRREDAGRSIPRGTSRSRLLPIAASLGTTTLDTHAAMARHRALCTGSRTGRDRRHPERKALVGFGEDPARRSSTSCDAMPVSPRRSSRDALPTRGAPSSARPCRRCSKRRVERSRRSRRGSHLHAARSGSRRRGRDQHPRRVRVRDLPALRGARAHEPHSASLQGGSRADGATVREATGATSGGRAEISQASDPEAWTNGISSPST